ncbi:MAG: aminodeoxychorismate/anthranilate synthase component II [Bacteroidales bacterium]|nr:aminodeoxychorismate/anthranilate synthase component II [Bacteroidales bacterium]
MKLLIADNNDSFTWNLVQLAREAGASDIEVADSRNFSVSEASSFDRIIFSPGPGLPGEFPAMSEILHRFPEKRILGVCLGLQAIGIHFGARLINMSEVMHGRQVKVNITEPEYMFTGLPGRFDAGLYHSWVLSTEDFPAGLLITATTDDGRIMAIRHRRLDIHGVQFHPESVMTPSGNQIIANWLKESSLPY